MSETEKPRTDTTIEAMDKLTKALKQLVRAVSDVVTPAAIKFINALNDSIEGKPGQGEIMIVAACDNRTCPNCLERNGLVSSTSLPPFDDCTSEAGCRCVADTI